MPATTQFWLSDAECAKLHELGRRLSLSSRPLSMADVIRLAVDRLRESEVRKQIKRKDFTPSP